VGSVSDDLLRAVLEEAGLAGSPVTSYYLLDDGGLVFYIPGDVEPYVVQPAVLAELREGTTEVVTTEPVLAEPADDAAQKLRRYVAQPAAMVAMATTEVVTTEAEPVDFSVIPGIGKRATAILHEAGIVTWTDLRAGPLERLGDLPGFNARMVEAVRYYLQVNP